MLWMNRVWVFTQLIMIACFLSYRACVTGEGPARQDRRLRNPLEQLPAHRAPRGGGKQGAGRRVGNQLGAQEARHQAEPGTQRVADRDPRPAGARLGRRRFHRRRTRSSARLALRQGHHDLRRLDRNPEQHHRQACARHARQDIVNITKDISKEVLSNNIDIDEIDEDLISKVSCCPVEEIDLLIRTGGDKRISNFLLYQIAYTEINFIDKYWPDFKKEDFINCLDNFKKVSRRFGKRI